MATSVTCKWILTVAMLTRTVGAMQMRTTGLRLGVKLGVERVPGKRKLHTVVMIRHGESTWNVEKRFTGWCDVPLTDHGEADAVDAGSLMKLRGLKFDVAFTSTLERAWRTLAIALSESDQSGIETIRNWRLNERHYGSLQGLNKLETELETS